MFYIDIFFISVNTIHTDDTFSNETQPILPKHIMGDVMVSALASSAVNRGFRSRSHWKTSSHKSCIEYTSPWAGFELRTWWQTLITQKVVNPPTIRSRAWPEVTEILHHITIVSSTLRHKRGSNSELSLVADVDCTGSCKSNYHTITSTTNPTNKD